MIISLKIPDYKFIPISFKEELESLLEKNPAIILDITIQNEQDEKHCPAWLKKRAKRVKTSKKIIVW